MRPASPTAAESCPPPGDRPAGAPWSYADAARFLGVGQTILREMVRSGKLRAARIGRRVLIPDDAVRALAAGKPCGGN